MSPVTGLATAMLPVPPGLPMDGYGDRTAPSVGTRDPLEVSVLYTHDGTAGALVMSLDVIAIGEGLVGQTRRALQSTLPAGTTVFVAATHTHCGPAGLRGPSSVESGTESVRGAILAATEATAAEAVRAAAPVTVRMGTGSLPAAVATDRNDPSEPIDRRVTVLEIRDGRGRRSGVVWHTAVHPTVLGPDALRYSADLPGVVRTGLRGDDEDLPVLFLNGAAGNVSTRFTRRARDGAELERLGALVVGALPAANRAISLAPIRSWRRVVQLATNVGDATELRRQLQEREEASKACEEESGGSRRRLESLVEGTRKALRRAERPSAAQRSVEVSVLRMGELVLVGLPGEMSSGLGRSIAEDGGEAVLPVGYANGYCGYLTDHDDVTYETLASLLEPGAGRYLAEVARAGLTQVVDD